MSMITIQNEKRAQVTLTAPVPEKHTAALTPYIVAKTAPSTGNCLSLTLGSSLDDGILGAKQPKQQIPAELHAALRANKANIGLLEGGGLRAYGSVG